MKKENQARLRHLESQIVALNKQMLKLKQDVFLIKLIEGVPDDILDTTVDDCDGMLSVSTLQRLLHRHVRTIRNLVLLRITDSSKLQEMGSRSYDEIEDLLHALGLDIWYT